jgi:threonylcarbamoyladenosine tRNA methylthiotransferase MtaB
VVVGCWATSNKAEAQRLKGVDAVIGHHDDVHAELNGLLDQWIATNRKDTIGEIRTTDDCSTPQRGRNEVWDKRAGAAALQPSASNKPQALPKVKRNPLAGTHSLPLLGEQHQAGHQRAFLKIQDGCDAHCTYCIIPHLRSELWSKPVELVVDEARRLVDCGHIEFVLTGIFLGAFGQPTAIHKRQPQHDRTPLSKLVKALCEKVPGLRRLRLSSLEPGDLTGELISELKSHPEVVPHFHLPLQSGSDGILRRMNRQYTRDDFLRMIEQVNLAFDRPAITTDIIVGFPGETDSEFEQTLDVVDRAGFIHIHAFSYSPRPGTAAARWKGDFVHGPVVNERMEMLQNKARDHGFRFRKQFVGESVELLVERQREFDTVRHGRSERYFDVWFEDGVAAAGDLLKVAIDRVTPQRTFGTVAHSSGINSQRMT